ncbi:MAG: hypothetical protein ACREFP_01105 [Acetobacteraceae bacterium]
MKNAAEPEDAVRLFGEARGATERREVSVGALGFTLEGLALRWIRFAGVEVLRGVAFVVRDPDWGTYRPAVRLEEWRENAGKVLIRLAARIEAREATLECRMVVQVEADRLSLSASAASHGRFETNRTGFVVLHGAACAGGVIRVGHAAGGVSGGTFPLLVSPHQPFRDIAAITHEPAKGLVAEVRFAGEVFEMEDQRNWSDASFKTYSRPLARPFPYVIGDGETAAQTLDLAIRGQPAARPRVAAEAPRIEPVDTTAGRLPDLGLGGRAKDYEGTEPLRRRLRELKPTLLILEADQDNSFDAFRQAVAASGARAAVLLRGGGDRLGRWRDLLAQGGVRPAAIALVTSERAALEDARRLFPGTEIGAGTDAFFAEFNRAPPPPADFQFWTVNPTVHATDDASVMETLSVLADQAASARALVPDVPLWVGPVTFRMRFNPNATGPTQPDRPGVAPADSDARQRGIFAASFTLGQIAAWAAAGVATLVLYAPFGPRGVIHAPGGFPVPWYDECAEGGVYPAYLVLAGLAAEPRPSKLRAVRNDAPEQVVALATADALWLANRGAAEIEISVPGKTARVLDVVSFAEAALQPTGFWHRDPVPLSRRLRLGSYAVARISL